MKQSIKVIAVTTVVTAAISFFVFSGFSSNAQPRYSGCGGSSSVASASAAGDGCCPPR